MFITSLYSIMVVGVSECVWRLGPKSYPEKNYILISLFVLWFGTKASLNKKTVSFFYLYFFHNIYLYFSEVGS